MTVFATAELISDDASAETRSGELDQSDIVKANEITERFIAALTREEATVLAGQRTGDSDGDIARRLGAIRPVDNRPANEPSELLRQV